MTLSPVSVAYVSIISSKYLAMVLLVIQLTSFPIAHIVSATNFYRDFDITWGDGRAKILRNGKMLSLSLDKASGSGFQSKNEYLFGHIHMQLKLVQGNSAGTVTAYYLKSSGSRWDEIDFEFLGNLTGHPYILHTNIFTQGSGNREQQFYLWFDPTKAFHTYSILWNPKHITFSVDGVPIRIFKNLESVGVAFPKRQPMRLYSSLWNADDWATRGGRIKTDWANAPFTAYYRNFKATQANCVFMSTPPPPPGSRSPSSCAASRGSSNELWLTREILMDLSTSTRKMLRWVRKHYMVYDYCNDLKRFPLGLPRECIHNPFH